MPIELDHTIVPSHEKVSSAKMLGELLGVPWAESGLGPFSPVYVNDGLTLDFIETADPFPVYHFCFRVSEAKFNSILGRIVSVRPSRVAGTGLERCTELTAKSLDYHGGIRPQSAPVRKSLDPTGRRSSRQPSEMRLAMCPSTTALATSCMLRNLANTREAPANAASNTTHSLAAKVSVQRTRLDDCFEQRVSGR